MTAKLLFAGDLFVGVPCEINFDSDLRHFFSSFDLRSCNLEGPICSQDSPPISKIGPNIRQDLSVLQIIQELDFNFLCLANNHILDYGPTGLTNTIKHLKDRRMGGAGTSFNSAYQFQFIKINDLNVCILNYGEGHFGALTVDCTQTSGFAWINHPRVEQQIRDAKKQCDFLILQSHAGLECVDLPLPEWRERYKSLIECGVDAIIGHHPHSIQPVEYHLGKPIVYSLGNFVFVGGPTPLTGEGAIACLELERGGDARLQMRLIELKQNILTLKSENESQVTFDRFNSRLEAEAYKIEINQIVEKAWVERYAPLYRDGARLIESRDRIMLRLKNWLLGRSSREISSLIWIHNLRIESHRWTVERASENFVHSRKKHE